MPHIKLKPNYKVVQTYYDDIHRKKQLSYLHEGSVAPHFARLLEYCSKQLKWTLVEQYSIKRKGRSPLRADGALLDKFNLVRGVWEAKDEDNDLEKEVRDKFNVGYPKDNILFQSPQRAILYQGGELVLEADISEPTRLVDLLKLFFAYELPAIEEWEQAVEEFKDKVPQLARSVLDLIREERRHNQRFVTAFEEFSELVKQAINPNISVKALEEMLIQHLLTERLLRTVFNNPDFTNRNIVAVEIEKVIQALTSRHFSRHEFLKQLDRFYVAIEGAAATITDFSQKQDFLNTVYENFFQGFSVKLADTHGIVYTPQPIVNFMVQSVADILQQEFNLSLDSPGVHILDPFVGTGNFILRLMRHLPKTRLPHKYAHELHCNEVMLLPYYIASMSIEHDYFELTGQYQPFNGICLVDTFELAEPQQHRFFVPQNTQRVEHQQNTPIFVILGNPPYNAGQVNENDNNQNRQYAEMDKQIAETYVKDSQATLNNALYDPYVKAFRWAANRITKHGEEGIVAFVTNNNFLDGIAFDGMRKHLAQDFDALYFLDLKGNVRKNPKISGTTHNVFGIQVGVSIALLIRKKRPEDSPRQGAIYYYQIDEFWRKERKYQFLDDKQSYLNIDWQSIRPNKRHTWLTQGMTEDFEDFLPLGDKTNKRTQNTEAIFRDFSNGVKTNQDAYVYNFNRDKLIYVAQGMVEDYTSQRFRWLSKGQPKDINSFLNVDESKLKWIRNTKRSLKRGLEVKFSDDKIRRAVYRPYTKQWIYFEPVFTEDTYGMPRYFSNRKTENRVICLTAVGNTKPFHALMTDTIVDLHLTGDSQCFPFYTYDEDGSNRQENITDWALAQFREQYGDQLSKWDIFHYIYGLLHHPDYAATYQANLRRQLPRIPFVADLPAFVAVGQALAELHVNYESQPEYPLKQVEAEGEPLNWRVAKMRFSRDKTKLIYNEFLTLEGIPPAAFDYRLGIRSALEWVVDRYRVTTDKRSGIVNDPNDLHNPDYMVRLVGQVITVSLETVRLINSLPPLAILEA